MPEIQSLGPATRYRQTRNKMRASPKIIYSFDFTQYPKPPAILHLPQRLAADLPARQYHEKCRARRLSGTIPIPTSLVTNTTFAGQRWQAAIND